MDGTFQGSACRYGALHAQFAIGDESVNFGQEIACLGIEVFSGFAKEQQRAGIFALVVAEHSLKKVPGRIPGIDFVSLLKSRLRFFHLAVLIEQLGLAAPNFWIARMLGHDLVHHLYRRFMLALGVLLEGPVDRLMDGLTAPLEFLAAAARAGSIWVHGHGDRFLACKRQYRVS